MTMPALRGGVASGTASITTGGGGGGRTIIIGALQNSHVMSVCCGETGAPQLGQTVRTGAIELRLRGRGDVCRDGGERYSTVTRTSS
jgi:hypothetical protein